MIDKRFEMIEKRFEMIDKRFEDLQKYMDKRFETIYWILALVLPALAAFSWILYKLTEKRIDRLEKNIDKRFENVDKRFEEVMSILFLLVKAHQREIGEEAIDIVMGRKSMLDLAKKSEEELIQKITEREKEKIKEYLKEYLTEKEIIELIANKINEIHSQSKVI